MRETPMKTAQEWIQEKTQFVSKNVCTKRFKEMDIVAIQADALGQAVSLLTMNADSPRRGFNAVYQLMLKLQNAKSPNVRVSDSPGETST